MTRAHQVKSEPEQRGHRLEEIRTRLAVDRDKPRHLNYLHIKPSL